MPDSELLESETTITVYGFPEILTIDDFAFNNACAFLFRVLWNVITFELICGG